MRKFILGILFLVCSVGTIKAQNVEYGIFTEFNLTMLEYETRFPPKESDFGPGFAVGIYLKKNLTSSFSFYPRLSFSNNTTKRTGSGQYEFDGDTYTYQLDDKLTGKFVVLDGLFAYDIVSASGLRLSLISGVSLGVLFDAEQDVEASSELNGSPEDQVNDESDVTENVTNNLDIRPTIGIGIENNRFGLEIIYKHGVTNFVNQDEPYASSLKGRYLSIGLKFPL